MAAFEQKDYTSAIANLKRATVPQVADYVAYYLAAAHVEAKELEGVAGELAPTHNTEIRSPLAGKAWVVEGRALGSDGVRVLREHYAELPQPDGDIALAAAYQTAGDLPHAVEFYQRVFYQYISGDAAARAAAALLALKDTMGASYPMPLPQQALQRADLLLAARQYAAARSEYESLLDQLVGVERGPGARPNRRGGSGRRQAGSRGGLSARARSCRNRRRTQSGCTIIEESARRMNDEAAMTAAVEQLGKKYAKSPWRLKAMAGAAIRYLVTNRPDAYLPLYKAAYEDFPDDRAGRSLSLEGRVSGVPARPAGSGRTSARASAQIPGACDCRGGAVFSGPPRGAAARHRAPRTPSTSGWRSAFPNQFYAMQSSRALAAAGDCGRRCFRRGVALPRRTEAAAGEARACRKPTRPTSLRIERSRVLRSAGSERSGRFGAAFRRAHGRAGSAFGTGDGGRGRSRRTSRCA